MGRTLVLGDVHGAHDALRQVFDRSGFDPEKDRLICLGDVADRRPGVKECVDLLLTAKNMVMIRGNHDAWALEWMSRYSTIQENDLNSGKAGSETSESMNRLNQLYNDASEVWITQGGSDTIYSYRNGVPESHVELLRNAKYYHIEGNRLFVHGGIDYRKPIEKQDERDFLWDRSLVEAAVHSKDPNARFTEFDEVFVGHTPTINLDISTHEASMPYSLLRKARNAEPTQICNIWMMDTGAGWPGGRLSMMDVETKEVWVSDVLE